MAKNQEYLMQFKTGTTVFIVASSTMVGHLFILFVAVNTVNSQLFQSLQAVLDFGLRSRVGDTNFLLGVAFAKGQLNETEMIVDKEYEKRRQLYILQQKADILFGNIPNTKDSLKLALSPHLWSLHSPRHQAPLPTLPWATMFAEPDSLPPTLSDTCLRSLLRDCAVPPQCAHAEMYDRAGAYSGTHQVLYWTIALQNCNVGEMMKSVLQSVIRRKCGQMYQEHVDILAAGLPEDLVDLYFEQVAVCGVHGYQEFLESFNQDLLLSLQTPKGCFALRQFNQECDLHFSGVATAALSLFLKKQFTLTKY